MGRIWPWKKPPGCPVCGGTLTHLLNTRLVSCAEDGLVLDVYEVMEWHRKKKRTKQPPRSQEPDES